MSLVASASVWNNDEFTNKKRQPTMRKTIKLRPSNQDVTAYNDMDKNTKPTTIVEQDQYNTTRNNRVNELLDKITSVDDATENKMGDFKPLSHPSINVKKDMEAPNPGSRTNIDYKANDYVSSIYSNYNKTYESSSDKPYFINTSQNIGTSIPSNIGTNNMFNDKMMEKINYMIHLLEETKKEKTANITEEFILYTFLGVFVIFVVDSFSRSRRYTR